MKSHGRLKDNKCAVCGPVGNFNAVCRASSGANNVEASENKNDGASGGATAAAAWAMMVQTNPEENEAETMHVNEKVNWAGSAYEKSKSEW